MDKKPDRVETTLFLVMSLDGKITSGKTDSLDSDKDWKRIMGVKEGFHQYYDHEIRIAKNSLNSGRVMEKIGINERNWEPHKDENLTFVIIDRKPHLNINGLGFLLKWVGRLILVTNNSDHPGFTLKSENQNLEMIYYQNEINFEDLFINLKHLYGIKELTIQSGGTLNTILVRKGLIDHVCVFIAPLLIGGDQTSSLLDGASLQSEDELFNLKALHLRKCDTLENSYIRIEYDVIKETIII
jgi:2,5-diamino-6-(ribosylamino)-4(3H)-pyrimidinone 5'-phosphate reductase